MIFIDSGAFVARYRASDDAHAAARSAWTRLGSSTGCCFTSNLVIAEAVTLLARYIGYQPAAERARLFLTSSVLTILRPDQGIELEAADLLEKYADQHVSFTDCVSFVLMKKHRLRRVFGFDRHFQLAGFTLWPGRAR